MTSAATDLRPRDAALLLAISAGLSWGLFALTGHAGLNVYDEGYLWYGVDRTLHGEIPIRDFQAYDPGRYYWCGAWSGVFGDGIVGIRAALSLIQMLGLACGLYAARRVTADPLALGGIGCVLLLWMFPRHKLIEPSLGLVAVAFTMRVLESPTRLRHFALGLSLGVTAFFGRNLGVYCGLGQLLALGLLHGKGASSETLLKVSLWIAGTALGYSPMLAMLLFTPGFVPSYLQTVRELTPITTPVPWPWRLVSWGAGELPWSLATWAMSFTYAVMVVAYPVGLWLAWRTPASQLPRRALLIAATCIGAGYVHHAVMRADLPHLAQSVHPLILGLLAAPAAVGWAPSRGTSAVLQSLLIAVTATLCLVGALPQLEALAVWPYTGAPLAVYDAAGDTLQLPAAAAAELEQVEAAVQRELSADEPLLILPYRAGYYPLLGRRSPVWGIFFIRAGEGESDAEMIRKLEEQGVDWVLYVAEVLQGLRGDFATLHPEVYAYLLREFEPLAGLSLPPGHALYRRRAR